MSDRAQEHIERLLTWLFTDSFALHASSNEIAMVGGVIQVWADRMDPSLAEFLLRKMELRQSVEPPPLDALGLYRAGWRHEVAALTRRLEVAAPALLMTPDEVTVEGFYMGNLHAHARLDYEAKLTGAPRCGA